MPKKPTATPELKITRRKLSDYSPMENNPNKHNPRGLQVIEDSINYNGAGRSGVATKEGKVIIGQGTWESMARAGVEDVLEVETNGQEWVMVKRNDLSQHDPRALSLMIADNRASELDYSPDDIIMAQLLTQIGAEDAALVKAAGFEDSDIRELMESIGQGEPAQDPGAQVDKAAQLQEQWQVERGDLWQIGKHRLLCGDSTNADDVARLMAGESAALAWFDPPFGIDLKPQRGLTDEILNDGNEDARKLWAKFLPLLRDALKDTAHVFLCQGWTEFDWTLPLVQRYFTLKSKVVWFKNVWGIGYYTRPQHEDIIYCWKGTPATPTNPIADVWQVAREPSPDHAAEKPPELSHIPINAFSSRGDIVVDWFGGVGGSMVACEQLGRQCRMIEISEKYCAVILQRMQDMGLSPERVNGSG